MILLGAGFRIAARIMTWPAPYGREWETAKWRSLEQGISQVSMIILIAGAVLFIASLLLAQFQVNSDPKTKDADSSDLQPFPEDQQEQKQESALGPPSSQKQKDNQTRQPWPFGEPKE